MRFIDFFAGIGGFRLGMEMAGHECVGHCEIDKYANKSYIAMHNPKEDEWFAEDITKVRADNLPRADCWCFGFPCQDISVAGKQTGFRGSRSSLFFRVTGLVADLKEEDKPSILFIENVKNLLSVNGGWDFAKLLIELDEIGYDAEWQVLNSKDFGVPQNRERVFIIGHLRGRSRREVFPIRRTDEATDVSIKIIAHRNGYRRNTQVFEPTGITEALDTGQGGGRGHYTVTTNKGEGNKIAIPILTPDRVEKGQNGRRFKTDGEPMFTLTGQDGHGVMVREATTAIKWPCMNKEGYKLAHEGDGVILSRPHQVGSTVMKQCANTIRSGNPTDGGVVQGLRIRKLTPKECFRLQGFPDEYFERAEAVNSNSQLYKQAGNSVTVNVVYEIARRL